MDTHGRMEYLGQSYPLRTVSLFDLERGHRNPFPSWQMSPPILLPAGGGHQPGMSLLLKENKTSQATSGTVCNKLRVSRG